MKSTLLRLLAVFSFLAVAAHAEKRPFVPASGLQISLTTGGYKFFVGETPQPLRSARALKQQASRLGGLMPTGEGFMASAVLMNSSGSDFSVDFSDSLAAEVKFTFTVKDADGTLVWQSDADQASAQVITSATLGKGQRWKRVLQIPLKLDGAWLATGTYTLEATLASSTTVSAKVPFEVASSTDLAGDTGIIGHVVSSGTDGSTTATKCSITIHEVRLPNARYDHPEFSWSGETDDAGNFTVATPPGSFKVTAVVYIRPPVTPTGTFHPDFIILGPVKEVVVTVEKGSFTETTITFGDTTVGETGITGTVAVRSVIGATNSIPPSLIYGDTPLAGAVVTITEIQLPDVKFIRGPWTFTTTTDKDGKFKQLTPSGRYRASAAPPANKVTDARTTASTVFMVNPIVFGGSSVELTVTQGSLSSVFLRLDGDPRVVQPL